MQKPFVSLLYTWICSKHFCKGIFILTWNWMIVTGQRLLRRMSLLDCCYGRQNVSDTLTLWKLIVFGSRILFSHLQGFVKKTQVCGVDMFCRTKNSHENTPQNISTKEIKAVIISFRTCSFDPLVAFNSLIKWSTWNWSVRKQLLKVDKKSPTELSLENRHSL